MELLPWGKKVFSKTIYLPVQESQIRIKGYNIRATLLFFTAFFFLQNFLENFYVQSLCEKQI